MTLWLREFAESGLRLAVRCLAPYRFGKQGMGHLGNRHVFRLRKLHALAPLGRQSGEEAV